MPPQIGTTPRVSWYLRIAGAPMNPDEWTDEPSAAECLQAKGNVERAVELDISGCQLGGRNAAIGLNSPAL
jgi:hypothetical protein